MGNYFQIQEEFKSIEKEVKAFIKDFDTSGETIYKGSRNELKVKQIGDFKVNIKRFKTPNFINQIVYRWFRKSKAERSYLFANILLDRKVGTPKPIAYQVNKSLFGILQSYYVCIQQNYDLTFRELIEQPDYPNRVEILQKFTRFTFHFHNQNVLFLDHSPGNTLIEKNKEDYHFYLVDLNRLKFQQLNYQQRMLNFARLSPTLEMTKIMATEYAKLTKKNPKQVFNQMWSEVETFRSKFAKKHELKRKIKFWK